MQMNMNIMLTKNARDYILNILKAKPGHHFRLSIKKTGCSGYAYEPKLIDNIIENDFHITSDDVTIYIDPMWAHVMQNLKIDYIEENKTGLKQKKLVFTNPNETARCGCGESFHIE